MLKLVDSALFEGHVEDRCHEAKHLYGTLSGDKSHKTHVNGAYEAIDDCYIWGRDYVHRSPIFGDVCFRFLPREVGTTRTCCVILLKRKNASFQSTAPLSPGQL